MSIPHVPGATAEHERDAVLDDVRAWFARYLKTVNPTDLDLLTLWTVHTHLCAETYTTPRLLIDSPVPGSGKTTCLEHLGKLCLSPVQMATLSSPAMLARLLDSGLRTVLIDEADRSLASDRDGIGDLIAVLNSGYKRGGTRPVLVPDPKNGWTVREMPTFCPVAMAGNNPQLPEDTRQRTIRVLLLPDLDGTAEESDWEMIEDAADTLARRIAVWADDHRDAVLAARPPMPDGITGRFREKWQPLKRVGVVAGGRWAHVVDDLALQDREQADMDRDDGMVTERPHVVLLKHLAELWPDGETFVPTSVLLRRLVDAHPDTWGEASAYGREITAQRFGRMLANGYKLNSRQRPDGNRERGYRFVDLAHLWNSMAIPLPGTVRTVPDVRTVPENREQFHGSNGTNGSQETPPGELCKVCQTPMSAADGHDTHANCEVRA